MWWWLLLLLLLLLLFSPLCIFPAKPTCCILRFLHLLYPWCLSLRPFSFHQLIYLVLDTRFYTLAFNQEAGTPASSFKDEASNLIKVNKHVRMSHESRNNDGYTNEQGKASEFAKFTILTSSSVAGMWLLASKLG